MLFYRFCRITEISSKDISCALKLLSVEQTEYINSLNESKKEQSVCVRALLNLMLTELFDRINISLLSFDENSKPILNGSKLYVSLTHSNDYVGCAISDNPVGIDIEKIRPIKDSVVNRVCSQDETLFIKDISNFFTLWTLKEAYIKAVGKQTERLKNISFYNNNKLSKENCRLLTDQIDDYIWSIVEFV